MQRLLLCTLAGIALLSWPNGAFAQIFLGKNVVTWLDELGRPEESARRNAAYALGKLGPYAGPGISMLVKRLGEDKSAKVREAAAAALGEIGKESNNAAATQVMMPALIAALTDDNYLVRRSGALALGNLGPSAAPAQEALAKALGDAKPEVRQNVAWALGKIGAAGLPSIRKALGDADNLVKRDAAAALAPLDPKTAREALAELLPLCNENNSEVRKAALTVLVKIVGPEDTAALAPIRQALLDPDAEVRANAALALSNIGGKDAAAAVPVLLDALRRGDLELRRQAAAAIRNIGPDAVDAVPELVKALTDQDPEIRANAALALGGIGANAEAAVPALVQVIANTQEQSKTRIDAAFALSRIGPVVAAVQAVPTLVKILQDPKEDGKVRERVIWALRVHKSNLKNLPGVFLAFTQILSEPRTDSNRLLRYDCAFLLGVLQGPQVPPEVLGVLHEYLQDDKIIIFESIKSTVGATGQETSVGKANVQEVGKGDGRVMAVEALTEIGRARIRQHAEIIQQLEMLANNQGTNAELRQDCKKLLKTLK